MICIDDIVKIADVPGVAGYILVSPDGKSAAHNAVIDPETLAHIISACIQNTLSFAGSGLNFICFSRKNNQSMYLFPVGRYCLGVIKETQAQHHAFIKQIIEFLNHLVTHSDLTSNRRNG